MAKSDSRTKAHRQRQINNALIKTGLYIIVILVLFFLFVPLFFMVISMFKGRQEIFSLDFHVFPQVWTIDNFSRLFYLQYTTVGVNFLQSFGMTLLVAFLGMAFSLFVNSIAGYAFARLNFPLKKTLFVIIISTMFIPNITILLTSISVVSSLNMMNTIWVLVIPGVANAYNIFFFRQFYLGFPKDYDEAARVDGCNSIQIFFKIYLPNSITPMVIMGAGTFIGYFNSYLWPTLTIDTEHKGLTQIMTLINSLYGDSSSLGYGAVLAASFIAILPAVVVFFIVQRFIRDGIALTGVK